MPARTLPEDFERLTAAWDALADRTAASPFARPGYLRAWWRAFGAGRLEILTQRDGNELTAVMPLAHRPGLALSPCSWQLPEFRIARADDAAAAALFDELFGRRPQLVSLRFLDGSDDTVKQLRRAADRAHYHSAVRSMDSCPVTFLEEDWSAYERKLSRNLKQDVARCRRRLGELGHVSLEVCESPDDLEAAFALEQKGWKGSRGTAMASRRERRQFWAEITKWAADNGWLRLVFLRAGARRVAFHLALESNQTYVPLKGGFDPAVRECSPGKLIIHATLERAFSVGLRRYEFLAGGGDYKSRWATASSDRLHYRAFASTLRGASIRVADAHARPIARRVVSRVRPLHS
jgi:CelD/BcsL family acetyltransferase involved in cellulose biosynthesis